MVSLAERMFQEIIGFERRATGQDMRPSGETFSAHHAPPLVADLVKVMELYQNDLSDAASIWSS
jgi:hypothetical protein